MKIIAKKIFSLNGIVYDKGDEVKVDTKSQLVNLNENGFIEPVSIKDIQNFGKINIEKPKKEIKNKEEE